MERVLVWVVVVVVVSDLSLALSSHFLSYLWQLTISSLLSSLFQTSLALSYPQRLKQPLLSFWCSLAMEEKVCIFFSPGCGFGFVLEMSKVHLAETHGLSTTIGDESCQQRYHQWPPIFLFYLYYIFFCLFIFLLVWFFVGLDLGRFRDWIFLC